jgi:hypothetical protein
MTFKIQVLTWDRHKDVAELNQLNVKHSICINIETQAESLTSYMLQIKKILAFVEFCSHYGPLSSHITDVILFRMLSKSYQTHFFLRCIL